jgi:serpin B
MRGRTIAAVLSGLLILGAASWAAAEKPAAGQEIKSVVAGRMVCSDKCQARLELANGLKKCANCDQRCNIANKYCTACAAKLGECEVCGKRMRAAVAATPDPKAAPGDFKKPPTDAPGAAPAAGDPAKIVAGNTAFACDLYQKLKDAQGNLFLSPYSISTALAMTYAGAGGETARQMAVVLHFEQPAATLHPAFKSLVAELSGGAEKKAYELSVANALWGQKDYKFLDAFLQTCSTNYGGGLRTVDFVGATEAARTTINTWVEQQTRDKIKELLKPGILTPRTRLVLTNAIYFKGQWETAFEKKQTQDAPFTLAVPAAQKEPAATVTVPMMHRKGMLKLYETDGLQVLELPYKGGDLSMIILLPTMPGNANGTPRHAWRLEAYAEFEKSITPERLEAWLKAARSQEVDVFLPRFTTTSEFPLAGTLSAMGMTDAFTPAADFSGMDGTKDLYISAVIHKAFVDVNEEGTEAAAATGVAMALKSEPMPRELKVFRADHPFIFLIRHVKTGSILFMGRVMNPKA